MVYPLEILPQKHWPQKNWAIPPAPPPWIFNRVHQCFQTKLFNCRFCSFSCLNLSIKNSFSYLAIACALLGPGDWSLKSEVDPHFLAPDMDRLDIELDRFRGEVADEGEAAGLGTAGDMWSCWEEILVSIMSKLTFCYNKFLVWIK